VHLHLLEAVRPGALKEPADGAEKEAVADQVTTESTDGDGPEVDAVLAALERMARAVEESTARNEAVAAHIVTMVRLRAEGWSYRDIVLDEERPRIVELATENLRALFDAGSSLRRAEARALHDQGLTMEQIARLFGVTRQRISELLKVESTGRSAA
jgi:hypothetical protein